jgi:F-type H+-transporting ATPase subunit b
MEKLISEFSIGLFFWQSMIFIGLLFLLRKYAWGPILSAVNERETSIKDALASAEAARTEMESLQSDNQRILKEARAEKEALLKEARQYSC